MGTENKDVFLYPEVLSQELLTVNVHVNIEAALIRQWFIIVETWFLRQFII